MPHRRLPRGPISIQNAGVETARRNNPHVSRIDIYLPIRTYIPVLLLSSRPKERPPSAPRVGNAFRQRIATHGEAPLQGRSPAGVDVAAVVGSQTNNRGGRRVGK